MMDPNKRQAVGVVSNCTSLNLRRAARTASQFLEGYLLPVGLHASQFGILSHLSRSGPITMTRMAEEMSLDRTTLTRNLQVLQRDGLVAIESGSDRRVREVVLTENGQCTFAQALPLWEQAEAALTERLGADRRQQLLSCLDSFSLLEEK